MINHLLKPVFKEVTGRELEVGNPDDRELMQYIAFLAYEKDIRIGDYNFFWQGITRPFSVGLKYDVLDLQFDKEDSSSFGKLSEDIKDGLADIKRCLAEKPVVYNEKRWLECVASAAYINHYVKHRSASAQEIEDYLICEKPYMRCAEDNKKAIALAKALFG